MVVTMKTHTVRINDRTHRVLRDLSAQTGQSMPAMIEQAVEHWRREELLRAANEAWARIIADPVARAEIEAERALWENVVADGLEPEDWGFDADADAR